MARPVTWCGRMPAANGPVANVPAAGAVGTLSPADERSLACRLILILRGAAIPAGA